MDFASALSKQGRADLGFYYVAAMRIGRLGHLLQALRHDARAISEYNEPTIEEARLTALAGYYGLGLIDIAAFEIGQNLPVVEKREESVYLINIGTQEELVQCCYGQWSIAEKRNLVDKLSQYMVQILNHLRVPGKKHVIYASFPDIETVDRVVEDLVSLGLLAGFGDYYFNPELFKDQDDSTLDLLSKYDIMSNKYMESVEQVSGMPGLPIESLDARIQVALRDLGRVGILVPVAVETPDSPLREFVFADPENLSNGSLSYETAAYFRFNECCAIPQFGRLTMLPAFITKLLEKGIAGEATNIGRNYRPLQLKGVFDVIRAQTSGFPVMVLRKRSVVEDASKLLEKRSDTVIPWKREPTWVSDPAATRAAQAKHMEKSLVDLRKLLKDYG